MSIEKQWIETKVTLKKLCFSDSLMCFDAIMAPFSMSNEYYGYFPSRENLPMISANRAQESIHGIDSASLWSLAGWYDNPFHTRFLAPMAYSKILARDTSGAGSTIIVTSGRKDFVFISCKIANSTLLILSLEHHHLNKALFFFSSCAKASWSKSY